MGAPHARRRVELEPAWVLRTFPWRETSLIAEAFSRHHGRVGLVAKGARRPLSQFRGLLSGFQPVLLSWSGQGELKTLAKAEWQPGQPLLSGKALLCAYYLNELILKLTAREDPHPGLFEAYAQALSALATPGASLSRTLRCFELALLHDIGLGLQLDVLAETGEPLDPDAQYHCVADKGVVPTSAHGLTTGEPRPIYKGHTLLAIAHQRLEDLDTLASAKQLIRALLDHHLDGHALQTRRVFMELSKGVCLDPRP